MLQITAVIEGPTHLYKDERYTLNGADVLLNHPRGYVVSGGGDHHTKVWDPATLEVMHNFHAGTHHDIKALAVSHDGKFVVSGHGSWGGVHLWDMNTGKLLWCQEKIMYVEALAFDDSDSTVVALSGDRNHSFDVQNGVRGRADCRRSIDPPAPGRSAIRGRGHPRRLGNDGLVCGKRLRLPAKLSA